MSCWMVGRGDEAGKTMKQSVKLWEIQSLYKKRILSGIAVMLGRGAG